HTSSPFKVTLTATEGGASDSETFYWGIAPRVALQNPGPQAAAAGDTISLALTGGSAAGTLSYTATGLPTGVTLNASTGLISGTLDATVDVDSPYYATVAVSVGTLTASQAFQWAVDPRITLYPISNLSSVGGDTVSFGVVASDALSLSLTYTATG